MQRLDLTLPTPAENLALDEAILDWAEEDKSDREFLRLWEPTESMVVVGRSSRVQKEVNVAACRDRKIPVLRRSSGGAAIVAGPGCLMYALVLSLELRPELRDITRAHEFVLVRLATSLATLLAGARLVSHVGLSDLALCGRSATAIARKFSGNSLRMKRTHLLYHGTLLYNFDLSLIETCLHMPPRQPDYRNSRPHRDFVMNFPATRRRLEDAVYAAWPTGRKLTDFPASRVDKLVADRFGNESWNYEFA